MKGSRPVNWVGLYDPGFKNHDYEMVIKALGDDASSMASYANLLNDVRFISRSFSQLRYSHTKWEGNKIAHSLARYVNISN